MLALVKFRLSIYYQDYILFCDRYYGKIYFGIDRLSTFSDIFEIFCTLFIYLFYLRWCSYFYTVRLHSIQIILFD